MTCGTHTCHLQQAQCPAHFDPEPAPLLSTLNTCRVSARTTLHVATIPGACWEKRPKKEPEKGCTLSNDSTWDFVTNSPPNSKQKRIIDRFSPGKLHQVTRQPFLLKVRTPFSFLSGEHFLTKLIETLCEHAHVNASPLLQTDLIFYQQLIKSDPPETIKTSTQSRVWSQLPTLTAGWDIIILRHRCHVAMKEKLPLHLESLLENPHGRIPRRSGRSLDFSSLAHLNWAFFPGILLGLFFRVCSPIAKNKWHFLTGDSFAYHFMRRSPTICKARILSAGNMRNQASFIKYGYRLSWLLRFLRKCAV